MEVERGLPPLPHRAALGVGEAWQRQHFHERMGGPRRGQSIIEVKGEPVGYLALEHREDEIFISNIQLCPKHPGHGLGSRLIADVMGEARPVVTDVTLQVFRTNDRAADLYDGLGFEREGPTDTHILLRWSHR